MAPNPTVSANQSSASAGATREPIPATGYAAYSTDGELKPYNFHRRAPTARDVVIKIRWSGICHSDLHTARGDWGGPKNLPIVVGHEIVGFVTETGPEVTKFAVGDKVGVGCMVDSCRKCYDCEGDCENYCAGMVGTYNGVDKYGQPTAGGYSDVIVVDEHFVLRVPDNIDFAAAAPLLCAGITTFSPLHHWGVKEGKRVGVAGLGGLGHMAVKFAVAMGAEVTVISTSDKKRADAERLGAQKFVIASESAESHANYFDFIIDTISAKHDIQAYAALLRRDGVLCLIGGVPEPMEISSFQLLLGRRTIAGSLIGGIKETQEMLDFCGKHNITCDIEIVEPSYLNKAWERLLKNDVKYRFVIDISKLNAGEQ